MAAATQSLPTMLALHQYLQTSYHPDCDFVDGNIEERNVGETPHNLLQVELAFWFRLRRKAWKVRVLTEQRTRVGTTRVRVPDVSVVHDDETIRERVRTTPPLIAIELLSPDDRIPRVVRRLEDYLAMGVEHIWLLDPIERIAYTFTAEGLKFVEQDRLSLPDSPIHIDLPEIFAALD